MSNGESIKLIEFIDTSCSHKSSAVHAMHSGCFYCFVMNPNKKNSNQTNKEAGMMEWLETVCWWHYLDSISLWQTSNAIDRYGFQPNKNWKQPNKMTSDHTRRGERQRNQSIKWNCRHHLLFYGLDRERDNLFGYCWVCGSDPIFIFKFFFLVVKHAHAHTQ